MFVFGLGKVPCLLCDRQVARKEAFKVLGQRGYAVCHGCLEQFRSRGGTCPQCGTEVRGVQQPGIFLEGRRSFGHADCGGARLVAA